MKSVEWELSVLEDPLFVTSIPENLNLDNLVFVYPNGRGERIIPYSFAQQYPLIYDYRYEGEKKIPITFTICPLTLNPMVYQGRYSFSGKLNQRSTVLQSDNNYISQFTGEVLSGNIHQPRRWAGRVDTLKNVMKNYLDPQYLQMSTPSVHPASIWESIPSQQLVYGIQYRSSGTEKHDYRRTLVWPKSNKFDTRKNGIRQYLGLYQNRLQEKEGVVQTTYLTAWSRMFPYSKVVKI